MLAILGFLASIRSVMNDIIIGGVGSGIAKEEIDRANTPISEPRYLGRRGGWCLAYIETILPRYASRKEK